MSEPTLLEKPAETRSYDFQSAAFLRDPFPTFERLRESDPVYWSDALRGWVLTGYDDVKQGMDMSVDFVRPFAETFRLRHGENPDVRDLGQLVGDWMSFFDMPAHTRLRGLLNQVVNRGTVEAIRPRIVEIAETLVRGLQDTSTPDIASRFSNLLPVLVIGEMLGIGSVADCHQLMAWSDELHLFVGQSTKPAGKYARAAHAAREMDRYFRNEIALRRKRPLDDGITRMIQAGAADERLTDAELAANCAMLFYAGHETTAGQISLALLALSGHKPQLQRLRADMRGLMADACEEFFRYDGPVQAMVRVVDQDAVIRGRKVRAGERIYPFINAANRDPSVFANADVLDIGRRDNRHIVFGHGVHFCIGSWLARAEVPIALGALLERVVDLDLAPGAIVEMRDSLAFRAPKSMPMELQWRN
jgi:cytochrome P450